MFTKFMINPKFILGDDGKDVVLAKVSEFFIEMGPDIISINDPDGETGDDAVLLDVRLLHTQGIIILGANKACEKQDNFGKRNVYKDENNEQRLWREDFLCG